MAKVTVNEIKECKQKEKKEKRSKRVAKVFTIVERAIQRSIKKVNKGISVHASLVYRVVPR
jgi:hypothetical protein